jgi:hypothetical protein
LFNQRVKKEIQNLYPNVEIIKYKYNTPLQQLFDRKDLSKKIPAPELSAAYCLSLLREKAKHMYKLFYFFQILMVSLVNSIV